MLYLFLKSLHILAAILWVGSLFVLTFITSKTSFSKEQMDSAVRITEAAIGFTWLIGIILTIMGSWYASPWWYFKIAFVVLISAIHTFLHRRWKNSTGLDSSFTNSAVPYIILVSTFVIVFSVVSKIHL